jgi:hypothetical protein
MTPLEELASLLSEKSRIFAAEHTIEFNNAHSLTYMYKRSTHNGGTGSNASQVKQSRFQDKNETKEKTASQKANRIVKKDKYVVTRSIQSSGQLYR